MHKYFKKKSIKITVWLNLLKDIWIIERTFCIFPLNMAWIDAISIFLIFYCFQVLAYIRITRHHQNWLLKDIRIKRAILEDSFFKVLSILLWVFSNLSLYNSKLYKNLFDLRSLPVEFKKSSFYTFLNWIEIFVEK